MNTLDKELSLQLVWQYSNFYGQSLYDCEHLHRNGKSYVALILLFETTESICKSIIEDYDSSFFHVVGQLKELGLISEFGEKILSTGEFSIRKIRNLFAHADLSNLFVVDDGIYHSLQEVDTFSLLYLRVFSPCLDIMAELIKKKSLSRIPKG